MVGIFVSCTKNPGSDVTSSLATEYSSGLENGMSEQLGGGHGDGLGDEADSREILGSCLCGLQQRPDNLSSGPLTVS